jgi:hypothetical protein
MVGECGTMGPPIQFKLRVMQHPESIWNQGWRVSAQGVPELGDEGGTRGLWEGNRHFSYEIWQPASLFYHLTRFIINDLHL